MFLVVTIVFLALRLGPLDPAQYILGDYATAETLKNLRESMGLDKPLIVQYLNFLSLLVRGDFGYSYLNKLSVLSQLLDVLPHTIALVSGAILVGIIMGVPPGILAALKPNSFTDHVIRIVTLAGISIPTFVIGIILLSIFSLKLDLLPAIGGGEVGNVKSQLLHLILPAFSCGLMMMASIARLVRASLLDVMKKDFVTTARSKGLSEAIVICKHALRNSLLPLVTYFGIYINILLGSAVLTEVIFTRPGVGRLIVEGIKSGDFPIVQTVIWLYAGAVVIVNLLTDITYCLIDPRVVYR
jgi:ABC-type dipeptide/oligopeptide/nickel transport system permease component